jgi:tRNA(Ile)-lysidine synthase
MSSDHVITAAAAVKPPNRLGRSLVGSGMASETALVRAAVKLWIERLGPGLFGVACSGGADSIALADATIAEAGANHVVVLTIDHGLSRGSAKIAEHVAAWARGRGAGAVVRTVKVERRASIEAAARDARYRALDALVDELGLVWVLTGHTARDQAETVLMRIVRGTGPAGLAGIPTIRGHFVRPLLELPRAVIDAYVAEHELPTWDDPMNADESLARVRFRKRLMPLLRDENPALDDALSRLASSAGEWMAVIDELAEPFESFPIDCNALGLQPGAVRKRAISNALEIAGLTYDAVHLDQIDELVRAASRGEVAIDVPGGRLIRSYDRLTVAGPSDAGPPDAGPPDTERPRLGRPTHVPPSGPYALRTWQPGDRMCPNRLRGKSRKLSDLYIDAKIPRELRRHAQVLVRTTDDVIVWAEHLGIAFGESPNVIPAPTRLGGSF